MSDVPVAVPARGVAYFSMEVALDDALPTFSGGLGVLAGDFLRAGADLQMPLLGVTLCYRDGYFRQSIDADGRQVEQPVRWAPEKLLQRVEQEVTVTVRGRPVRVRAWRLRLRGAAGGEVPVYFLDTDVEGNDPEDRSITDQLYGGDGEHRLAQEAVLGLGGVAMLRALGPATGFDADRDLSFHMNEGHSALLTLALLEAVGVTGEQAPTAVQVAAVRDRCVFTTHTPVPAGHDRFPLAMVEHVLEPRQVRRLTQLGCLEGDELNMTELGIRLSCYVNAVSRRHGEVSRAMFPRADIDSVTNGVHLATWACAPVARLFDGHLPGWRTDSAMLRYAGSLPEALLAEAHAAAKAELVAAITRTAGLTLDPAVLTIGIARRATPYKQTTLLFTDLERLAAIARGVGPLQVVCSGKAHPRDEEGKQLIATILAAASELRGKVEIVFVENYDLGLAGLLCAGCDLWLNTPVRPNEASGTSGMKAAVNGVPSLSVLDGWWLEGCIEGVTGWSIGEDDAGAGIVGSVPGVLLAEQSAHDSALLYDKLEGVVAPLFYGDPTGYRTVMRNAIALNGSFFSADRMVREYAQRAYRSRLGAAAEVR